MKLVSKCKASVVSHLRCYQQWPFIFIAAVSSALLFRDNWFIKTELQSSDWWRETGQWTSQVLKMVTVKSALKCHVMETQGCLTNLEDLPFSLELQPGVAVASLQFL